MFLTYFLSNDFVQLVNFPTRENNILDVILVDDPFLIADVIPDVPFGSSDHISIHFNLNLYLDSDFLKMPVRTGARPHLTI
jgi:hypothetical protein